MFSLSCSGDPSAPNVDKLEVPPPLRQHLAYETFLEKQASVLEPQRPLTHVSEQKRLSRNFDSLAVQVQPLHQANSLNKVPSKLMEIIRMPAPEEHKVRKNRSHALSYVDLDEIELPSMHEGLCRVYCQPNMWSPAFASPGDFTIKMSSVFFDCGIISFRIAVMCCCARSVCDGSRVKPASKRQYYVSYVDRTQEEIGILTEALSLQYIGHRLSNKMPTHGFRLIATPKQRALNEYGDRVIQFLSFVMQITETGFNRLVKIKEPVANNVRMRDFLGLSLNIGEQTIIATSSCDARIEGQGGGIRPSLPSAWLDVDLNVSADLSNCGKWNERPVINEGTFTSTPNPIFKNFDDFGELMQLSSNLKCTGAGGMCVRFVTPSYWLNEAPDDKSFTVEISSVTIMNGVAKFAISVLQFVNGELAVNTLDHRYSEFDKLAVKLEEKIPALQIRRLLPPKTFFRYRSANFLERRAAYLQQFLERVLCLHFPGVLDQNIPLTAEPHVRDFLKLPSVEWVVVSKGAKICALLS